MIDESSIARTFGKLAREGRRALIPFFTAGYPSKQAFLALLDAAEGAGADIMEVGIPFSDPLADGPSIQYSSQRALAEGATLRKTLGWLGSRRAASGGAKVDRTPLVLMTYVNPLLALGWRGFAEAGAQAGVDGVIVPDLPLEEAGELQRELEAVGLDLIYLVTPTTEGERLRRLAGRSRGFLYLVTVTGVTGTRDRLPGELSGFVARARRATELPLCLGFGISTKEQAAEAARLVDGVIVGSAIVELIRKEEGSESAVLSVSHFLADLRYAVDNGRAGMPLRWRWDS